MSNFFQPATMAGAVTNSDSTVLNFKRLYVGGTGDVAVQFAGTDVQVTYKSVPAGAYLNVAGDRVLSTGTSATSIVWENW